ncbi:RNA-directed DNA polymerase from mobile element jockey-like [Elysia marginata]|uniref:RNA-directed DNA polymerase from mobile element jockey-like n=1 Tax=Elysia marginata TaxID=1093978 RepID=A0AAV4I295_9GAST|nr:RNA-directed DNA polymerase from mobile element jockey-like [Elysia marginata]
MKRWTEYVEDLFDDTRSELGVHSFLQGPDILPTEVESALHHMRNGKVSGIDNISKEMLQAMGDFGINIVTEMCNKMYHNTHIPEDLRTSIFILLPKKQRAVECSDFRTISLMCHTLKLLLTIILRRISDKINKVVGREQAGFRKNSGTREAIFCLRNLTEKYLEMKTNIYACFIDYSKAFDNVGHNKLIDILNKTEIDQNDIELIARLYWNQKTRIRLNSEIYTPVNIVKVVSCPPLFLIYTQSLSLEKQIIFQVYK